MALTEEKFNLGMTSREYIDQIKVNKDPFLDIYRSIEVPSQVQAFFNGLAEPLRMAVFTADWCGDALSTTPALLRLAEGADRLSVRVFNRDQELELNNTFLPENRAGTVPVFVVLDSSMGQVARFIETASELVPAIDAMDDLVAQEMDGDNTPTTRPASRGKRTAFRVAHARGWGEVILREFGQLVADGVALPPGGRPMVGGTKWLPQ